MTIAVIGGGLVGVRAARLLAQGDDDVTLIGSSREPAPIEGVTTTAGASRPLRSDIAVALLATDSADQPRLAERLLRRGVHVVSTADDVGAVQALWSLGGLAKARGASLIVGAAYSPGLSSLLVAWSVAAFDDVIEIDIASLGTGGPACARQHHRSMNDSAFEVRDGRLRRLRGGSGRSLVWFPESVGGADCYRAGLSEPFLLHQAFPEVPRIQARQAATRRDRLTARLPMLRAPHAEGLVGGLWVEVRGRIGGRVEHRVVGVTGTQATGSAHTAATLVGLAQRRAMPTGASTAAMVPAPAEALARVSAGVRIWTYDGSMAHPDVAAPIQAAKNWKVARSAPTSLIQAQFKLFG